MPTKIDQIRTIKNKYEKELLLKDNVIGCAIGYKEINEQETDELCIIVYVNLKTDSMSTESWIPTELENIKVDVQECLESTVDIKSISHNSNQTEYCSMFGGMCKYECLEEQKINIIKKDLLQKNLFSQIIVSF